MALFSEEMKVAAFLRFTLEGDLRRAIGEEELQVVFQSESLFPMTQLLHQPPHLGLGLVSRGGQGAQARQLGGQV